MSSPIPNNYGAAGAKEAQQRNLPERPIQNMHLAAAERTGCAASRVLGAIASGAYKAIKAVAKFISWPARTAWCCYRTRQLRQNLLASNVTPVGERLVTEMLARRGININI